MPKRIYSQILTVRVKLLNFLLLLVELCRLLLFILYAAGCNKVHREISVVICYFMVCRRYLRDVCRLIVPS